jgi:hypothetical protein
VRGKFSKFWFVNFVLCFAFIAIPLSACECFALENKIESKNPHHCCDEPNSSEQQNGDCSGCLGCTLKSGSSVETNLDLAIKASSFSIDTKFIQPNNFVFANILSLVSSNEEHTSVTSPPGSALSPSLRSAFLQRWLL